MGRVIERIFFPPSSPSGLSGRTSNEGGQSRPSLGGKMLICSFSPSCSAPSPYSPVQKVFSSLRMQTSMCVCVFSFACSVFGGCFLS